tara:strand:+ start:313 stop:546 length:234 start_codon:yes stop_codon:yes gene_type:complete
MNSLLKETLKNNFNKYIELLENDEFKKHLIRELNDDIDIPIINEKTEKKILNSIYNVFIKSLKKTDIDKLLEKTDDK